MGRRDIAGTLETQDRGQRARVMLSALTLVLALGASLAPASARGAPPLSWSTPTTFDSGKAPSAVSCVSEVLCVAVDSQGDAMNTSDPSAPDPSWSTTERDPGEAFTAASCAPAGPCIAVDGRGYASVGFKSGAPNWSTPAAIDPGTALTGVSCPTASLCVAVDNAGDVLTSTSPVSGSWQVASIDHEHPLLTAVSCASPSLCVAVDAAGDVLSSVDPAGGATAWHLQKIDSGELLGVSCASTGACVAVDGSGQTLASADPAASPATWSLTPVDGERLAAVSCSASGLCVAVDVRGTALASDDPTAPTPTWSPSSADSGTLASISCLPSGFCLAVDSTGHSVAARVSAPGATTLAPTEVTDASATLAGAVDPNDAVLGACIFEYGTAASALYTQAIPCSVLPAPSGNPQAVSAQLSNLAPNTTYHYRLLASSQSGTSTGANEAFTTPSSSQVALVHPNPSIAGTPANGQQLTCHAGLLAGASAQLSYAWLRDLIPIAGASGSTYTVKGQDTGHHLQCQVTATNGGGSVTANSAFVTIPIGGVPVSAGETAVGKAAFKNGRLSVPLVCSAHANGGCQVALRLTAVETLSGHRIVALAARATNAHKSSAALRHVTVTLASVHVHLPQGAHRTVLIALNTTGKRILNTVRHFSAYVYVTGTVIGVIEAQLAQQLLALNAPPHSASSHAARRR
jgi:hypothetical protein